MVAIGENYIPRKADNSSPAHTAADCLGRQTVEERNPFGRYYPLKDLLYRGVALTNSSGQIVEAYGNTLIFTGPGPDGLGFTDDDLQSSYGANEIIYCGYRFDPETQLYYVRNRTYNPVLGRWIQRDPIGISDDTSLYNYVHGSPTGGADPHGTATWNQCCPKLFSRLDEMIGRLKSAEVELGRLAALLATLAGQVGLARRAYLAANRATGGESLAGLLFGSDTGAALTGAVAVGAINVKEVSGLITNSRLVRAGIKGFRPLSASAKTLLRIGADAAIYAAIAQWATGEFLAVADVRQRAKILYILENGEIALRHVLSITTSRYREVDGIIGLLVDEYYRYDKRQFGSGAAARCAQLVGELDSDQPLINSTADQAKAFADREASQAGMVRQNLMGLLHT